MPGIPCNQVLAIVRIRQWAFDRQALKTGKTTDYQRTGLTQRKHRAADARIVRVLSFEKAFSTLSAEHQTTLAAKYRDNLPDTDTAAILNCSIRKVTYLLPIAREQLADTLNRHDVLQGFAMSATFMPPSGSYLADRDCMSIFPTFVVPRYAKHKISIPRDGV